MVNVAYAKCRLRNYVLILSWLILVTDQENYLNSLGVARIEEVKRDAAIGKAQSARDAAAKTSEYQRMESEAKFEQ